MATTLVSAAHSIDGYPIFEFLQAPQMTALKGRPISPAPVMAFRPFPSFPLESPQAAIVAFSVNCFIAEDAIDVRSVVHEVAFACQIFTF